MSGINSVCGGCVAVGGSLPVVVGVSVGLFVFILGLVVGYFVCPCCPGRHSRHRKRSAPTTAAAAAAAAAAATASASATVKRSQ